MLLPASTFPSSSLLGLSHTSDQRKPHRSQATRNTRCSFPFFDMEFLLMILGFMTLCLDSAAGEIYRAISGCKGNHAMASSQSQRFSTRSVTECAQSCSASSLPCASFNACKNPAPQGSSKDRGIECELFPSLAGGNCSLLQSSPGCSFKEKVGPKFLMSFLTNQRFTSS